MSDLLRFTKASFLSGATDATAEGLGDFLERSAPGFASLQKFFTRWLRLDLTTIILLISFGGDLPNALTGLQKLWTQIYWWITRFFTASISIASNDKLNREVLNWLGAHVLVRQGTRILTARTEVIQNDAWYDRKPIERDDLHHEKRVPVQYLPTFGTTWFFHEGGFFMVRRVPRNTGSFFGIPDEYSDAPQGDEPLVVMRLGRSIKPIKSFLDNCRDFADKQRESFITVRATKDQYGQESWDTTILRPIRPLETVHFDEKTKQELITDIKTYLHPGTRAFYTERGIPYRRGYLFYGPPGTGKTSLSLALASYFSLELYLVHIPSLRSDNDLENLFTALPPKCIVLLEDIDAVGIERRKKLDVHIDSDDDDAASDTSSERDFGRCRCTLSGLLNVLDGVASQEGRIVLMTSNVAHKLDKALVRPGRIDQMIYLGNISQQSAKGMFERMYRPQATGGSTPVEQDAKASRNQEDEFDALAESFSRQIPNDIFTPAQLQGYLLKYRIEPETAVERVADWVIEEKRVMNEAQEQKKAESAKKKALKMKALKALAASQDIDESDGVGAAATEDGNTQTTSQTKAEVTTEEPEETASVSQPESGAGKAEDNMSKKVVLNRVEKSAV